MRRTWSCHSVAHGSPTHMCWLGKLLAGTILVGFGIFNLAEGLIDLQLLGIHHVNETVPHEQWIWWDLGFLLWGVAMLIGGWVLLRKGQQQTTSEAVLVPPRQSVISGWFW